MIHHSWLIIICANIHLLAIFPLNFVCLKKKYCLYSWKIFCLGRVLSSQCLFFVLFCFVLTIIKVSLHSLLTYITSDNKPGFNLIPISLYILYFFTFGCFKILLSLLAFSNLVLYALCALCLFCHEFVEILGSVHLEFSWNLKKNWWFLLYYFVHFLLFFCTEVMYIFIAWNCHMGQKVSG